MRDNRQNSNNQNERRFGIFALLVIGVLAFALLRPHGPPTASSAHGAIQPPSQVPSGHIVIRYRSDGLPLQIAEAMKGPDLAPKPGKQTGLALSTVGQKQFITTEAETPGNCGSGGCGWDIKDMATQRELLEGLGEVHKVDAATHGFYDLVSYGEGSLTLFQYDGNKYIASKCYTEGDDWGGPLMLASCRTGQQYSATPGSDVDEAISVDSNTILSAYQSNEQIANARYANRTIAITGDLTNVFVPSLAAALRMTQKGFEADAFVTMGGSIPSSVEESVLTPGIIAYSRNGSIFGQQGDANSSQLRIGRTVTLVCKCDGGHPSVVQVDNSANHYNYSVLMEDCTLKSPAGAQRGSQDDDKPSAAFW
jgi:hypothetical protein